MIPGRIVSILAIGMMLLGPSGCENWSARPQTEAAVLFAVCDGTGLTGRGCTTEWLPSDIRRWLMAAADPCSATVRIVPAAATYGKTEVLAPLDLRARGQTRGNQRLRRKACIDELASWAASVPVPADQPNERGREAVQSNLPAALARVGRTADRLCAGTGRCADVHVASDTRMIVPGVINLESGAPVSGEEAWELLGDEHRFSLSSVRTVSFCGVHDLDLSGDRRKWTQSRAAGLQSLWEDLVSRAGGPTPTFSEECATATSPATTKVASQPALPAGAP